MKLRALTTAMAALALTTTPTLAQGVNRLPAPMSQASDMEGESSAVLWVLLGVVALVGIILIVDDDDDDEAESP